MQFIRVLSVALKSDRRDFVMRMTMRQNRKLNGTYLSLMFDWDSTESSVIALTRSHDHALYKVYIIYTHTH